MSDDFLKDMHCERICIPVDEHHLTELERALGLKIENETTQSIIHSVERRKFYIVTIIDSESYRQVRDKVWSAVKKVDITDDNINPTEV